MCQAHLRPAIGRAREGGRGGGRVRFNSCSVQSRRRKPQQVREKGKEKTGRVERREGGRGGLLLPPLQQPLTSWQPPPWLRPRSSPPPTCRYAPEGGGEGGREGRKK